MGREGRAVQRDPSTTNAGKGAVCGVGKAPPGGAVLKQRRPVFAEGAKEGKAFRAS